MYNYVHISRRSASYRQDTHVAWRNTKNVACWFFHFIYVRAVRRVMTRMNPADEKFPGNEKLAPNAEVRVRWAARWCCALIFCTTIDHKRSDKSRKTLIRAAETSFLAFHPLHVILIEVEATRLRRRYHHQSKTPPTTPINHCREAGKGNHLNPFQDASSNFFSWGR